MNQFIARYQDRLQGMLSGFDRLLFRGTMRALCGWYGMDRYLATKRVLYKDFGEHAARASEQLKQACLARAQREGRPIQYLASSGVSKEEIARGIARRDGIGEGLICVLTCVEPCWSFGIWRDRETRHLRLQLQQRKCLHLYQYWIHREFGFMHGRIQSWFPFRMQVCMNGREWLVRQMEGEGLRYVRQNNCVVWVEDWKRAQWLLGQQLRAQWPQLLAGIAAELNPAQEQMFGDFRVKYYWSTLQSEWAMDLVFRQAADLRRLYPKLIEHGMTTFGSGDVLRFLGRKQPTGAGIAGRFQGEVTTDLKRRQEGVRIKHWVNGNTIKIYDKAFTPRGSVLRVETTIYKERDFRVYRPKEGEPQGALQWRPLRRGIADLYRRAEVSQRANERYLEALASVDDSATVEELVWRLEQAVIWKGKRVRGLRLFQPDDAALLDAISRGEFTVNGLRNRDLQRLLFASPADSVREARRRSAWVSRRLRLLRAHGLLRKLPHTHRYQVTSGGRRALTAISAARRATVAELTARTAA